MTNEPVLAHSLSFATVASNQSPSHRPTCLGALTLSSVPSSIRSLDVVLPYDHATLNSQVLAGRRGGPLSLDLRTPVSIFQLRNTFA